jgi:uncharacterized membrane protein
MSDDNLKRNATYFTGVLAGLITLSSILFGIAGCLVSKDKFEIIKDVFSTSVERVLLPMLSTVVASVLTYIFGKEVVSALAARIRAGR